MKVIRRTQVHTAKVEQITLYLLSDEQEQGWADTDESEMYLEENAVMLDDDTEIVDFDQTIQVDFEVVEPNSSDEN